MLFKVSIKMPSLQAAIVSKTKRSFNKAMSIAKSRVVPLVTERAKELVAKSAPMLADRYRKALAAPGAIDVTSKGLVMDISDPLVIAVERGSKGFDMKPMLLAHATKSSKKGGPYIDIPFKHAAGSIPSSIRSIAMRATKEADAQQVRVEQKTPGKAFTRMIQRGRVGQALGLKAKKQQVQHKRGIHDDMIRTSNGAGKRASYQTIRRISANSAASSWWNPGFKAAHVFDKLLTGVRREVSSMIRDAFSTVRSGT